MPGLHYECKIVYKSAMDPAYLDKDYDTVLYPEKDYHTLYFGEVADCYERDSLITELKKRGFKAKIAGG